MGLLGPALGDLLPPSRPGVAVYPVGTNDFLWLFALPISAVDDFSKLEINFGAGLVGATTIVEYDAHSVRVAYSEESAAGLPFRYVAGGISFSVGSMGTTAGTTQALGASALVASVVCIDPPDNTTYRWSFKDASGALPVYLTGPADAGDFATACGGLQLNPSGSTWLTPDVLVFLFNGRLEATYPSAVTPGRPYRTAAAATGLTFENGQACPAGQTGNTA